MGQRVRREPAGHKGRPPQALRGVIIRFTFGKAATTQASPPARAIRTAANFDKQDGNSMNPLTPSSSLAGRRVCRPGQGELAEVGH